MSWHGRSCGRRSAATAWTITYGGFDRHRLHSLPVIFTLSAGLAVSARKLETFSGASRQQRAVLDAPRHERLMHLR